MERATTKGTVGVDFGVHKGPDAKLTSIVCQSSCEMGRCDAAKVGMCVLVDVQVVSLLLLLDFSRVQMDGNQRDTDGKSCRIVGAL